MTVDERFGQAIRERREAMGLTQAEVSEALREAGQPVSPTALAKAEAGARAVKVAEAVALATILSMHLDVLTLSNDADDLAGMASRARAEATTTERAAHLATEAAQRSAERADALEVLVKSRTEKVRWRGKKADLLEAAFGVAPTTARAGLLAMGLRPDVVAGMERDFSNGARTDWRDLYASLRLSRLLPNLDILLPS